MKVKIKKVALTGGDDKAHDYSYVQNEDGKVLDIDGQFLSSQFYLGTTMIYSSEPRLRKYLKESRPDLNVTN